MINMIYEIFYVAVGGALGSLCRYAVKIFLGKQHILNYFYSTLFVNIIGCLLIGMAYSILDKHVHLSNIIKLLFITGFLGAFTTFSTYGIDTANYMTSGLYGHAIANILLNNVVGILMVFFGLYLGRVLVG